MPIFPRKKCTAHQTLQKQDTPIPGKNLGLFTEMPIFPRKKRTAKKTVEKQKPKNAYKTGRKMARVPFWDAIFGTLYCKI